MTSPVMDTYARLNVSFSHGEGIRLFDQNGKAYVDAISGIGVNGLGHAHPAVTSAISEQAGRLIHTSNLYQVELQSELAATLTRLAGMDNVFFGNSGAEANEAAIKLARLYGHQRGVKQPAIVVMENAFHGRTMATLSATGNRKIQAGFEPLVQGFVRAPFGDLQALETIAQHNTDVVAVLVEPVQGEGGIQVPYAGYLKDLRELCDRNEWLLMLDEVQTGNCRSGNFYACQGEQVTPDVIATAKALANGLPMGACLASGAAADVLQRGNHGSTYGGNPLACAAALATLNTMEQDKLADRAAYLGSMMLDQFRERLLELPGVNDVRGRGLLLGIELAQDCGELVGIALEQGYLINVTAGNVMRLLPPLVMQDSEAQELTDFICNLVSDAAGAHAPRAASA